MIGNVASFSPPWDNWRAVTKRHGWQGAAGARKKLTPLLFFVQVDLVKHKQLLLLTAGELTCAWEGGGGGGGRAEENRGAVGEGGRGGGKGGGEREGVGALKVEGQKGWPHFDKVFMVSALTGDGVEDLKVPRSCLHDDVMMMSS